MKPITAEGSIRERELVLRANSPEQRLFLLRLTQYTLEIEEAVDGPDAVQEIVYRLVQK